MKSEIDSWAAQQTPQAPDPNAGGQQQVGGQYRWRLWRWFDRRWELRRRLHRRRYGQAAWNYAVPGSCPAGSGYCYGHSTGNTVEVPPIRPPVHAVGVPAPLRTRPAGRIVYGQWRAVDNTARSLGYLVNTPPHYGAVMVFERGQYVNGWYADPYYGHVAVVERVNADGSVLISEGAPASPPPRVGDRLQRLQLHVYPLLTVPTKGSSQCPSNSRGHH